MKKIIFSLILIGCSVFAFCQKINVDGKNAKERFLPPTGFERVRCAENSFGEFLRTYKLKPFNSPVLLYNGKEKANKVHASVFDMPLLKQDLIQCADAIIKLRAEYLYKEKRYSEIEFHITNGMLVPFSKYAQGERLIVSGNNVSWKSGYKKGYDRDIFDEYLKTVYVYAGTYSLSQESKVKNISEIKPGDFFIFGGTPGHVVLVLDVAENKRTGEKIMLLGQSFMPSQEFHILKSYDRISPWYYVTDDILRTPEWIFQKGSLKTFDN